MTDESARLRELMAVEPPEFLDALVQERAAALLARRAVVCARGARSPLASQLAEPRVLPHAVAPAERLVYASGLALYGGQALYALGRLLLRALSG